MTFESISVPGLSDVESDTVNRLLGVLSAREPYNRLRQSHYEMRHIPRFGSDMVPDSYRRLGLVLGWAAKGVDGLRNRCNVNGFSLPDGDLGSFGLSEFMDDNRLLSELGMGLTASLVHGPAFLVNTAGVDDEPASLLHARSAMVATGDYNRRTRRMDNLMSVLDTDDSGRPTEFALYLDGLTITCAKDGRWSVTSRQEHGYGVPVEVLRYRPNASREYGVSRISRAAMGVQDAAVRALIRLEGHMDVYSYPEMWVLGPTASVFKNPDGSTSTALNVMLGRVRTVPDNAAGDGPAARADVKQLQAASPEPHLATLNSLAKVMAREFDLPDSSFALSDYSNPTSADSYVEGRDELISTAETAMDEWSVAVRRAVRRGLAIQNRDPQVFDALRDLEARWRSPLHLSRAAEADAGMKQLSAVPWLAETEVGLELLGLSTEQIKRAQAERRRNAGRGVLAALTEQAPPDVVGE